MTVGLDELLTDRAGWPLVADMIRSEQVPANRMSEIAREYTEFWGWLYSRPTTTGGHVTTDQPQSRSQATSSDLARAKLDEVAVGVEAAPVKPRATRKTPAVGDVLSKIAVAAAPATAAVPAKTGIRDTVGAAKANKWRAKARSRSPAAEPNAPVAAQAGAEPEPKRKRSPRAKLASPGGAKDG